MPEQKPQELITGVPDFTETAETSAVPVYEHSSTDNTADENWGYTVHFKRGQGDVYKGRRIIGRDTTIDGGVYFGNYGGEAIVVDSEKYSGAPSELFAECLARAQDENGEVKRDRVLNAVFNVVSERMKYSQEGVDKILEEIGTSLPEGEFVDGTKVALDSFIIDGVGVCRHQALTAALMLEKMKAAGHIRGEVSVDRSMRWSPNGEREGHAWVRYTNKAGEPIIMDIAQGYLGYLRDSEGDLQGWDYLRPEEQLQRKEIASGLGSAATPELARN